MGSNPALSFKSMVELVDTLDLGSIDLVVQVQVLLLLCLGLVTQLVRVLVCHAKSRGFKSHLSRNSLGGIGRHDRLKICCRYGATDEFSVPDRGIKRGEFRMLPAFQKNIVDIIGQGQGWATDGRYRVIDFRSSINSENYMVLTGRLKYPGPEI